MTKRDPAGGRPSRPVPATAPTGAAPLITIAVPAYRRPALLAQTLASIASQTVRVPLEVIVCDDGGLPDTQAAVDRFGAEGYTYVRNPAPLGGVGNWNRCLGLSRGEWVMVLHEDDTIYPWYLESVLPRLRAGTVAVCVKTVRGSVPPELARPRLGAGAYVYPPPYFMKSSMTPFPGVLMRRERAQELGGFDERWGPLADYEFWYRLACSGRVEVVRTPAAFYRVAPGQWTEEAWERMLRLTHLLRLRIAREQFSRHRRAGKWLARFHTFRNARSYRDRFGPGAPILTRCLGLGRIPFSSLPSGWVWTALRIASRHTSGQSPSPRR